MSDEYFFGEVEAEADLLGADVVFEFAADGEEAGVVTADDLVLDEAFLEGVSLLE